MIGKYPLHLYNIAVPGEVLGMKTSCNQLLLIDSATNIFAHAHED